MRATTRFSMGTAILLCALLLVPATLAARTITVDNDAPADFTTIQAAIDDANDGDQVVIQPGTYTGLGNRDIDFKDKTITVRSIDPNDPNIVRSTVINCQQKGRGFSIELQTILPGLAGYPPIYRSPDQPPPI